MGLSKPRGRYDSQFRRKAAQLVQESDVSLQQIADELGVASATLARWVKAVEEEENAKPLTASERNELKQLRKENKRIRMEREILKKAGAFFAAKKTPSHG